MEYDRASDLDPSYYRQERHNLYPADAHRRERSGIPIGSLLAGFGLGFGLAMLFAPKSGVELRAQFNEGFRSNLDRLREQASRIVPAGVRQRVQDFGRQAMEQMPDLRRATGGDSEDIAELLNNVSKDELISIKGIGPVLADRIIRNRPFRSDRELLDNDVLPENTYQTLKRELLSRTA